MINMIKAIGIFFAGFGIALSIAVMIMFAAYGVVRFNMACMWLKWSYILVFKRLWRNNPREFDYGYIY